MKNETMLFFFFITRGLPSASRGVSSSLSPPLPFFAVSSGKWSVALLSGSNGATVSSLFDDCVPGIRSADPNFLSADFFGFGGSGCPGFGRKGRKATMQVMSSR